MKRILTILLFVLPCFGQTNNPDMVVTLVSPKTGVVYSNTIQLIATVSFKSQLPAPTIIAIK